MDNSRVSNSIYYYIYSLGVALISYNKFASLIVGIDLNDTFRYNVYDIQQIAQIIATQT